jgi:hypothetical protein
MLFEDAGNQWSLSRPILSLIMTSEQVPSFIFYFNNTFFLLYALSLFIILICLFLFVQMFTELRAHILASQVRAVLCLKFHIPLEPLVPFFLCWDLLIICLVLWFCSYGSNWASVIIL